MIIDRAVLQRMAMAICLAIAHASAAAQAASFDRTAIAIDPAHGGSDSGAQIAEQVQEKDVTLAVAEKLRALLTVRGFHVIMTRDGQAEGGTLDQRAEIANRSHAVACLVLHASSSTEGVLVGTSALKSAVMRASTPGSEESQKGVPWSRAQETYLSQSALLANQIGTGLSRAGIAATLMRVVLRPLDNLTCPAVSIEIGVSGKAGPNSIPVTDGGYQQKVAESIAASLQAWRNQAQSADSTPTLPEGAAS